MTALLPIGDTRVVTTTTTGWTACGHNSYRNGIVLDPFAHVEPSVLCLDCGMHGFIRDGRWQDAGRTPAPLPEAVTE